MYSGHSALMCLSKLSIIQTKSNLYRLKRMMKAKKITVLRMNAKKMVGKLDLKLVFAQNKTTSKKKC